MFCLKNSIVERVSNSYSITGEDKGNKVIPFGLNYEGSEAYQESAMRGEPIQQQLPWFNDFCRDIGKKEKLSMFQTGSQNIYILCPSNVKAEHLTECFTLALLADIFLPHVYIYGSVKNISASTDVQPELMRVIEVINGKNNWNSLLGLLDCKNKSFMCRQNARLSSTIYKSIHPDPIRPLLGKFLQVAITDFDSSKKSKQAEKEANEIAFSFLQESFFK